MTQAHLGLALRAIAIAIAIGGLIDPAGTVSRPPSQKLIAIRLTSAPAVEVERALRSNLAGWIVETREPESRLPCGTDEQCVVIADGSMDATVPDDLSKPVSLIVVSDDGGTNVSVRSVSVSRGHQNVAGVARVQLAATGIEGRRSEIRVLDRDAVIGSVSHEWSNAATPRLRSGQAATVDVLWWPIDTGARTLRVEAVPLENERTRIDNRIDVGVTVTTARSAVLVFDARPSWGSTFVRRAIEDDARFLVGYRTRLAPALSAGTANGRLDAAVLEGSSAVVIGGPDALTPADVGLLEQYVHVRGGTLFLLPERAPAGPWSRLLPGSWSEHLTAKPETVGPLYATEVLRADQLPITATVVAQSGSSASIVVLPSGNGRIVVSGAMDAWRYRDLDSSSFDKFWRSLIAEGAAWGEGTQLIFGEGLSARGSRARFTIRDRRMAPAESIAASAIVRCGSGLASTVRLWPAGTLGEFNGEVPLASIGSCSIEAAINARQAVGSIAIAEQPMLGVEQTLAKLERRVTASGGVVARAGEEATAARAIANVPAPALVATQVHPMRAAWWIVPFAGCLSVEWWLRRRSGLR